MLAVFSLFHGIIMIISILLGTESNYLVKTKTSNQAIAQILDTRWGKGDYFVIISFLFSFLFILNSFYNDTSGGATT